MKRFAFVVVAALSLVVGSACSGGGASCKKTSCAPACTGTKSICDSTFTCVEPKTCSPACKTDGTEYCDPIKGTCTALKLCSPACTGTDTCDITAGTCTKIKTCSPVCAVGKYCDVTGDATCKDIPVCSPVCTVAGESCSN